MAPSLMHKFLKFAQTILMINVLFLHECDYRNLMKKAREDKVQYCTLQRLARYRNLPLICVPKGDKRFYTFMEGPRGLSHSRATDC